MKKLILFFALSVTFNSFAAVISELFEEPGKFIVAQFEIQPGKLQRKISEKTFTSKQLAQIYLSELKQYSSEKINFKLVSTEVKNQFIWTPEHEWDLEGEKKYQEWVAANLNEDFFYNNGIETDCADVAYLLRWIFARAHKYPMASTLAGSGTLFTHESMKAEWANLKTDPDWKKDQRFLAALKFVTNNTYTVTLPNDIYPTKFSNESFAPGTINLLGGHTLIVYKIVRDGSDFPLHTINSTVPTALQKLSVHPLIQDTSSGREAVGFSHYRWAYHDGTRWRLKPKKEMPWYSEEQYDPEIKNLTVYILDKLSIKFDAEQTIKSMLQSIRDSLKERINVVKQGFKICSQADCSPGTQNYEDHSTPHRDERLQKLYQSTSDNIWNFSSMAPQIKELWDAFIKETISIQDQEITMEHFFNLISYEVVSEDPRDSELTRWGLDPKGQIKVLNRKFQEKMAERKILVEKAKTCRDRACDPNSQTDTRYNTFSTGELDRNILNKMYSYSSACLIIQKCSEELPQEIVEMMKSAFYVSDPNQPVNIRWGEPSLKKFKYFPVFANNMKKFSGHIATLGNGKFYDLKEKKIIHPELTSLNRFQYNEKMYAFVKNSELAENQIQLIDESFEGRVFDLPVKVSNLTLYQMDDGIFAFSSESFEDNSTLYHFINIAGPSTPFSSFRTKAGLNNYDPYGLGIYYFTDSEVGEMHYFYHGELKKLITTVGNYVTFTRGGRYSLINDNINQILDLETGERFPVPADFGYTQINKANRFFVTANSEDGDKSIIRELIGHEFRTLKKFDASIPVYTYGGSPVMVDQGVAYFIDADTVRSMPFAGEFVSNNRFSFLTKDSADQNHYLIYDRNNQKRDLFLEGVVPALCNEENCSDASNDLFYYYGGINSSIMVFSKISEPEFKFIFNGTYSSGVDNFDGFILLPLSGEVMAYIEE